MSLFKLSEKPFFKDNPEAEAIEIFREIGDEGMKYLALVYMWRSPLRKMDLAEKKKVARSQCGFKKTPTGRPSKIETDLVEMRTKQVTAARDLFLEMDFDEDVDYYLAYCEMLSDFKSLMRKKDKSTQEYEKVLKIAKEYDSLMDKRKELAEKLELKEEAASIAAAYYEEEEDDIDEDESEVSLIEKYTKQSQ